MMRNKLLLIFVVALLLSLFSGIVCAAPRILVLDLAASGAVSAVLDGIGVKDYVVVQDEDSLKAEWARLNDYKILLFAYHEMLNAPATKALIEEDSVKLVNWVKAGGCLLSTTRDDPADNALLEPFGLSYSGADATVSTHYEIADLKHPIFNTPKKIVPEDLIDELESVEDKSMVDIGLDPGKFKVLATFPEMPEVPVLALGEVGKGKVIFTLIEVFFAQYTEVPTNLALVANIIDYFSK